MTQQINCEDHLISLIRFNLDLLTSQPGNCRLLQICSANNLQISFEYFIFNLLSEDDEQHGVDRIVLSVDDIFNCCQSLLHSVSHPL